MSWQPQAMHKLQPVRSEKDLDLAKARLAELLLDDGRDDDVEILSLLIEDFEKSVSRVHPPTPIAAIKFRMEELGLAPRHLEPFIGSRARVSEVLSGKRTLSIDMIRSLHDGLAIPYESLLSERRSTVDYQATQSTVASINSLGFDLDSSGIATFVKSALPNVMTVALHKKTRTQRAAVKTDPNALQLWQAVVLKRSENISCERFDSEKFRQADLRDLALLSTKAEGPSKAVKFLAQRGVIVVNVPQLPGTYLDGAAMLNIRSNPVIGITLRHDRVDGFWFTLLHECAHVALHINELQKSAAIFVDDLEMQSEDQFEIEADNLARNSLVPPSIISQVRWDEATTQDELTAVASRSRVHISIVAGRWQRDHHNYKRFSRLIERGTVKRSFK